MGKRSKRGIPEERIEKVGLHGLRRQHHGAGSVGPILTGSTTGPATLPE